MKFSILAPFGTIALLETLEHIAGQGVAIAFAAGSIALLLVLIHEMDEVKK